MGYSGLTQWPRGSGQSPARLLVAGPPGHYAVGKSTSLASGRCLEVGMVDGSPELERVIRQHALSPAGSVVGVVLIEPACQADLAHHLRIFRRHLGEVPVVVLLAGRRAEDRLGRARPGPARLRGAR
jgi:hypothetical protein